MRLGRCILVPTTAVFLTACAAAPTRVAPLPERFASAAAIPGIADARYWGDAQPRASAWLQLSEPELVANFSGIMNRPHDYLALSGGGSDGAFGAGLLVGWTAHGSRTQFTMVTGISTGALIAPFAFLGPGTTKRCAGCTRPCLRRSRRAPQPPRHPAQRLRDKLGSAAAPSREVHR
jgi:hypothetical protein